MALARLVRFPGGVGVRMTSLDPASAGEVEAGIALWGAAHAVDLPGDPAFESLDRRACIAHRNPETLIEYRLAYDGDRLLGTARVSLPQLDNKATALVDLVVHPDVRRQGIGRALWADTLERMPANGRTLLMFDAPVPSPAEHFAAALGAQLVLRNARRRLTVDTEGRALAERLAAQARPAAAGYELRSWVEATPDQWVDGMAYLVGRMSSDVPLEGLDWEPEPFDASRLRSRERSRLALGRRSYTTIAVDTGTGAVAAYTVLVFNADHDAHAWQEDTLVDLPHRGHRLGLLLKTTNLLHTLAEAPQLQAVITWNAQSNSHMIAVNEAMGFRLWDNWATWQIRV